MSKRMKIIFALSLLLNALLAGLFGGHMIASHNNRPITEIQEIRSDMRADVAIQRAKLAEIMKAEVFDQTEFDAQLQIFSDAQCNFNREFMIRLNEKVQKMPVAERAEVIDKTMSRRGGKGKPRRR